MLKLNTTLQNQSSNLKLIILRHHNPQQIISMIPHDKLIQLNFQLQSIQDIPFFIKYIFTYRQPTQTQINLLTIYLQQNHQNLMNQLIFNLINKYGKQESCLKYLYIINNNIKKNNIKEVRNLFKVNHHLELQYGLELLKYLINPDQSKEVLPSLQSSLCLLITNALTSIQKAKIQIQDLYLQSLAILLNRHTPTATNQIVLLDIFISLSRQFPVSIAKIIKKQEQFSDQSNIPNCWISRALFELFSQFFESQFYFKSGPEAVSQKGIEQICTISCKFYCLLKDQFLFENLGWVSIFGMRQWIDKTIKIESLINCIGFLRQLYYHKHHMISEILVTLLKLHINTNLKPNFPHLLKTITLEQLNYLSLQLINTLTPGSKIELIKQAKQLIKSQQYSIINHLINSISIDINLNIKEEGGNQQIIKIINQMRQRQIVQIEQINDEILNSSYNSAVKCIEIFQKVALFQLTIHSPSKCLNSISLRTLLNYCRHIFLNDFYSQQYWLTLQKMKIFTSMKHQSQALDILFDFLHQQKSENLSMIMLISSLLQNKRYHNKSFQESQINIIQRFINFCMQMLKNQVFTSNILIILQFYHVVSQLHLPNSILQQIAQSIHESKLNKHCNSQLYTKINYWLEAIMLKINQRQIKIYFNYQQYQPFFNKIHQNQYYPVNEEVIKIYKLYENLSNVKLPSNYQIRQLKARQYVASIITTNCNPHNFFNIVKQICKSFKFQSPTYKNEIVVLTYLQNSPQDTYFYKNHFIPLLHLQYVQIFVSAAQKLNNLQINTLLYNSSIYLLKQVLNGNTLSHGQLFYKSLIKVKTIYNIFTSAILITLQTIQIKQIIQICIQIISKDNYPLLRQYVEVVLCRAYITLSLPQRKIVRDRLLNEMRVNVSIGIPIALILGYQLLLWCKFSPELKYEWCQIETIHEALIKFISCHTAYLRAICQYYLLKYLQFTQTNDHFLNSIRPFWMQDKDSQKILTNIAMVINGFKQAVQNQIDFLGFERVEEYPSNRLKLYIYRQISRFYSDSILNQFILQKDMSSQFFLALNSAAEQRYEHLRSSYLSQLQLYLKDEQSRNLKSNMKIRQQRPKQQKKIQMKIKSKQKKGKIKKQQLKQQIIMKQHTIFDKYQQLKQFNIITDKYCNRSSPRIIVIATLLQKVHNFGHILRTLHNKNAMIVVPSNQPLLHPECKQLIPPNCDVQIVQIKERDLLKFIKLMKSLGYPLVALEQCSNSVMVQEAKFPEKLMLLLGNERLGAPTKILREGDLLVQINQIGKIRSLNVHVSMVICLWEYLSR